MAKARIRVVIDMTSTSVTGYIPIRTHSRRLYEVTRFSSCAASAQTLSMFKAAY